MADRNAEILRLRAEITRLKVQLNELDSEYEPTSVACGHDVVLAHLRKLKEQHGLSGLCQLAGIDQNHGWYTTNIIPDRIRAFLEDASALRGFLAQFSAPGVWEALAQAFHGELIVDASGAETLVANGLMEGNRLTENGFLCYAVLGHLAYNVKKKLPIPKTIAIFKLAYEVTGREYGEQLPYSEDEFLSLLQGRQGYPELLAQGITDTDIKTYIRQLNLS